MVLVTGATVTSPRNSRAESRVSTTTGRFLSGLGNSYQQASRNVGRSDLRGLTSLGEVAGTRPLKKWIAFLGESTQLLEGGVRAWPYLELLEELASGP
jgi:hypothetical protein